MRYTPRQIHAWSDLMLREELRRRKDFVRDMAEAFRVKDVDLKKYLRRMEDESA